MDIRAADNKGRMEFWLRGDVVDEAAPYVPVMLNVPDPHTEEECVRHIEPVMKSVQEHVKVEIR